MAPASSHTATSSGRAGKEATSSMPMLGNGGRRTASMTWATPLLAMLSALTTVARNERSELATVTLVTPLLLFLMTQSAPPDAVSNVCSPDLSSADSTCDATTWYRMTCLSCSLSARSAAKSFSGRAANAALFGAKTEKLPSPLNASTRPAALTAANNVDKSSAAVTRPASDGASSSLSSSSSPSSPSQIGFVVSTTLSHLPLQIDKCSTSSLAL